METKDLKGSDKVLTTEELMKRLNKVKQQSKDLKVRRDTDGLEEPER